MCVLDTIKFMKTKTRKEKLQIHLLALHTQNYHLKDVSHLSNSIINHMARWELQVNWSKHMSMTIAKFNEGF